MAGGETRLPLVPLTDIVHFPRTELRLHVLDPTYVRLAQDLSELDEDSRWIGVVLLKPGYPLDPEGRPEIFPGGTAARVMDLEIAPDGHSDLLVYGERRFELEREVGSAPYRQGLVHLVEEPWLNERDAGVVAVRKAIVEHLRSLAEELGDKLPLDVDDLASGDCAFEELVNRIASRVDLPALRKLQLLREPLPERGLSVLSILRSRQQVIDMLRPFRKLARGSEHN
jgi:Lon protease-like protein